MTVVHDYTVFNLRVSFCQAHSLSLHTVHRNERVLGGHIGHIVL